MSNTTLLKRMHSLSAITISSVSPSTKVIFFLPVLGFFSSRGSGATFRISRLQSYPAISVTLVILLSFLELFLHVSTMQLLLKKKRSCRQKSTYFSPIIFRNGTAYLNVNWELKINSRAIYVALLNNCCSQHLHLFVFLYTGSLPISPLNECCRHYCFCLSIYQFLFCLTTSDTSYACNDPTGKNHVLCISQPLSSEAQIFSKLLNPSTGSPKQSFCGHLTKG